MDLYDHIVDPSLLVRRITIAANHIKSEEKLLKEVKFEQLDLFSDAAEEEKRRQKEKEKKDKERNLQEAILHIHNKYGKNSLLKGSNFVDGATMKDRNQQIGGHRA